MGFIAHFQTDESVVFTSNVMHNERSWPHAHNLNINKIYSLRGVKWHAD